MCRLQNALEVRGVALSEWQLLSKLIEGNAPGDCPELTGDFEQAVQPPRDRAIERLIVWRRQNDDAPGGDVLSQHR